MAEATVAANAVDAVFERTRAEGRLAFIPYLTAGYPDREGALVIGEALATGGADMIELGIPFSDPLGDGPTIQRSSAVALQGGMTVTGALQLARELAERIDGMGRTPLPLVVMGYYNPLLRYGLARFCADAAAAGIAALIVPDLPVEESDELRRACRAHGMHLVYLLAPTSTQRRIEAVAERAAGFIYCMAVTGVTGARTELADELPAFLARVRAHTALPLVVGFGISRPEHLRRLHGLGAAGGRAGDASPDTCSPDGAVVASALIDLIDQMPAEERATAIGTRVSAYIERMKQACSAS